MLLCLDVGNTHIVGAVFKETELIAPFRHVTNQIGTADQFGLFLKSFLKEHDLDYKNIDGFSVSSVVPKFNFALKKTVSIYFPKAKYFMLSARTKTQLKIKYKNPDTLGSDLIAGAIGAAHYFPNENVIIIDMGTVTTITAIESGENFLGGAFLPGMRTAMNSVTENASRLADVDVISPENSIGKTTEECIQSGIYYGQLGSVKEIVNKYKSLFKNDNKVIIIATGGFSQMFQEENIYDHIIPDLVLQGLRVSYEQAESSEILRKLPARNLFRRVVIPKEK